MKKALMVLGLLIFAAAAHSEERQPQFRLWKSSALQGGNYANVLLSSSPIIFHMVVGSPTVNQSPSYFAVNRSTGSNGSSAQFTHLASTKVFAPLDASTQGGIGLGVTYDIFSDSYTFFQKQGAAVVNYEWDFYSETGFNKFPKD